MGSITKWKGKWHMRTEMIRKNLNGKELVLRNPKKEDAKMLLDYMKTICGESSFLLKEPEEMTMTVEEEEKFIQRTNDSKTSIMLLGFLDGVYVGNCSLNGSNLIRKKHRVSMGIALYEKFTGLGIGTSMMEELIALAKQNGFEQLELDVFSNNTRAIHLYQKMGFEIYGTIPNAIKYKDGTYADEHLMMRKIGK